MYNCNASSAKIVLWGNPFKRLVGRRISRDRVGSCSIANFFYSCDEIDASKRLDRAPAVSVAHFVSALHTNAKFSRTKFDERGRENLLADARRC